MAARPRAGVTVALVLGALFPDIDAALVLRGFDAYLQAHASGTHTVIGTFVGAVVVAVAVRAFVAGASVLPIIIASWAGAVSHVLCDLADGSDIRVFEPFSSRVFGWHLVVMGEPIVLALLVAGAVAVWLRPLYRTRFAVATLAVVTGVLVFKAFTQRKAREAFAGRNGSARAVALTPKMAALFEWTLVERAGDRVRAWTIDARSEAMSLDFERRDATGTAVVPSTQLPVVRTFLGLARVPFARTEQDGAALLVLWSDAATCSARGCDVSFGGGFDAGRPLFQLIRVGGFIEKRALPASRP